MKKIIFALSCALGFASLAHADVVLLEKDAASPGHQLKLGDKLHRDALAKSQVKPNATGSITLIDASGLEYFINTDITFTTSSSASGAMSEASYTNAVSATTSAGGVTNSTLNDAFDGYNSLCLSFDGSTGPCATANASYSFYNDNGAATLDTSCGSRQVLFPTQNISGIDVSRQVYVPATDSFGRWLNTFTNTTGAPITFNMITGNNLGSDSNTVLVTSSSGDAVATTADLWVTTFQNYSGTTSSDPRIGHVLQGAGATIPLSAINFVDGDDNPYWTYTITLAPGQTAIIANFVTALGSKAAAAAKAAELAALPASTTACMTAPQIAQIGNFTAVVAGIPAVTIPAGNRDGWIALASLLALLSLFALRSRQSV